MSVPINNKFGVLLAEKRAKEKHNISLADVADEINVSRKTLYAWQNNTVDRFDAKVIEKLCQYFGVGLSDLLELVPSDPTLQSKQKTARK